MDDRRWTYDDELWAGKSLLYPFVMVAMQIPSFIVSACGCYYLFSWSDLAGALLGAFLIAIFSFSFFLILATRRKIARAKVEMARKNSPLKDLVELIEECER